MVCKIISTVNFFFNCSYYNHSTCAMNHNIQLLIDYMFSFQNSESVFTCTQEVDKFIPWMS